MGKERYAVLTHSHSIVQCNLVRFSVACHRQMSSEIQLRKSGTWKKKGWAEKQTGFPGIMPVLRKAVKARDIAQLHSTCLASTTAKVQFLVLKKKKRKKPSELGGTGCHPHS